MPAKLTSQTAEPWSSQIKQRFSPNDVVDVKYKGSNETKYKHLGAPSKNRLFIDDYRQHHQSNAVEVLMPGILLITKTIKPDPVNSPEWVVVDSIAFKFDGDPDFYARMDTKLLARTLAKIGYSYDGEIEALTDNYSEEQPVSAKPVATQAKPTTTPKPKPLTVPEAIAGLKAQISLHDLRVYWKLNLTKTLQDNDTIKQTIEWCKTQLEEQLEEPVLIEEEA